jgi:hypothetical protein
MKSSDLFRFCQGVKLGGWLIGWTALSLALVELAEEKWETQARKS